MRNTEISGFYTANNNVAVGWFMCDLHRESVCVCMCVGLGSLDAAMDAEGDVRMLCEVSSGPCGHFLNNQR